MRIKAVVCSMASGTSVHTPLLGYPVTFVKAQVQLSCPTVVVKASCHNANSARANVNCCAIAYMLTLPPLGPQSPGETSCTAACGSAPCWRSLCSSHWCRRRWVSISSLFRACGVDLTSSTSAACLRPQVAAFACAKLNGHVSPLLTTPLYVMQGKMQAQRYR